MNAKFKGSGAVSKDFVIDNEFGIQQAGKKKSRRDKRVAKAARLAPRPTDRLRVSPFLPSIPCSMSLHLNHRPTNPPHHQPVVHCPTIKYNRRVRAGRGFSLAELKAAGIPRKYAPTIGISVDPRRQNLSEEGLKANVERLQEYTKRVIVFPRRSGKTKQGDSSAEDVKKAREGVPVASLKSDLLPIKNIVKVTEAKVADEKSEEDAYKKLRKARSDARLVGVREKRKKAKEEEEQAKKK